MNCPILIFWKGSRPPSDSFQSCPQILGKSRKSTLHWITSSTSVSSQWKVVASWVGSGECNQQTKFFILSFFNAIFCTLKMSSNIRIIWYIFYDLYRVATVSCWLMYCDNWTHKICFLVRMSQIYVTLQSVLHRVRVLCCVIRVAMCQRMLQW